MGRDRASQRVGRGMQTICPHLPQDPGLWHLAMPILTSWPPFLLECRHPCSRLCPGDTWSFLLLSQTHFLPLRPTSHCHSAGMFPKGYVVLQGCSFPTLLAGDPGCRVGGGGGLRSGSPGVSPAVGPVLPATLGESFPWLVPSGDWRPGPTGRSLSP